MKNGGAFSIGHDQVHEQLAKILQSERFGSSQLLSAFLKFIVEDTLAGRANAIKEYTIGTQVLGRSVDFNPQTDAAVRIHAGRLRRLLAEYYRREGSNDEVFIEIPKGSYVPLFKNHAEARATEANSVVDSPNAVPPTNEGNKTTAHRKVGLIVFPFQNLSQENSNDYFVENTGELFSSGLAKFSHISVISYYSIGKATTERKDISDIHKTYNVDYILTGSIRFSKKILHINIQFVCAETGTLAWTQTFIQPYNETNLYTVQDGIIDQVVNKIADIDGLITKNVINGPLTPKKEVFGIYFAAYQYLDFRSKHDKDSYQQARIALEDAARNDPQNALIWSLSAELFLSNYVFQFEPSGNNLAKAREYADRALWLDPNCQYAYEAMGWVYFLSGQKDDCMEMIERCLDLNPRALSVVGNMGFLLLCLGKPQQAFHLFLRTMHLSMATLWYVGLGFALYYYNNGEYKEAMNWIERTATPEFPLKALIRQAADRKVREQQTSPEVTKKKTKSNPRAMENANQILDQYIYDVRLKESLLEALVE